MNVKKKEKRKNVDYLSIPMNRLCLTNLRIDYSNACKVLCMLDRPLWGIPRVRKLDQAINQLFKLNQSIHFRIRYTVQQPIIVVFLIGINWNFRNNGLIPFSTKTTEIQFKENIFINRSSFYAY